MKAIYLTLYSEIYLFFAQEKTAISEVLSSG